MIVSTLATVFPPGKKHVVILVSVAVVVTRISKIISKSV